MGLYMPLQVRETSERREADVTRMELLPAVNQQVPVEGRLLEESCLAYLAREDFPLGMGQVVRLEVRLLRECKPTHVADVGLFTGVGLHMSFQV